MNDPARDHHLLVSATREAGTLALSYFGEPLRSWNKGADDPVSEADLAVDGLLRERLLGARPGYGWLSEETEDSEDRLTRARIWVVDPIDGTRAFIAARPEFTICAALIESGRPVAAAVFNPASGEFFEARAGQGARLNGETLQVGSATKLGDAHVLANKSLHKRLKKGLPGLEDVRRSYFNSIAYRASLVAAGRYDAALSSHRVNDWDIAAADLIVHEAGGLVTDLEGRELRYNRPDVRHNGLIVACPGLHPPLRAALAA